ncbi:MAG: GT4 family glycosyltransferase PelF [Planctomycetes bacterium]|nr:GT4 family glycosyltransferase PelF [Planctomycetota bacterium]MCB9917234.1 GT4 family glycosyltransferase PelF [Planctomycetota bacterium]
MRVSEHDADRADVCLVLEGTYPFVAGGVSSWVHQIISALDELTFFVLHISPVADYYDGYAYELPDNVIGVREVFLHEPARLRGGFEAYRKRKVTAAFAKFLSDVRDGATHGFEDLVYAFQRSAIKHPANLLVHRLNWPGIVAGFREQAGDESFLNYFWNWYYAHQPLARLLTSRLPRASVYHTISTGYAGVLAAAAAVHHDRPMILTEHGIYTKERRIEIHAAEWIQDRVEDDLVALNQAPFFRRFWNHHFEMMSRICYDQASEIFTLYNGNVREQIKDGADPAKIRVIPNGISLDRFDAPARRHAERPPNRRFTVGFVGRVCPIKDVRTLVAATRVVKDRVPDVLVRVLGPMEEDPQYAEECQKLALALDLEQNIRFEGRVAVHEVMPELDVLVLTSISEAQPLVILEGGAVGLPVVATDVGSCHELLGGRTPEDRALGIGGLITPIASPGATGRAILELWADESLRHAMGRSLQERVRRFYDQVDLLASYRSIYRSHIEDEVLFEDTDDDAVDDASEAIVHEVLA